MKKLLIPALSITVFSMLLIASCKFKNNDNITPTYRNQATGTGANPNINVVTVTGTQTVTNMATQNSALQVGNSMAGWSFEGCSNNPNMFVAHNGNITIVIKFSNPIATGAFVLTSGNPGSGQAQMTVYNAPGQPEGIVWYSKSGSVNVTPAGSGYMVSFTDIQCLQYNFLFPVVTVSGNLIC